MPKIAKNSPENCRSSLGQLGPRLGQVGPSLCNLLYLIGNRCRGKISQNIPNSAEKVSVYSDLRVDGRLLRQVWKNLQVVPLRTTSQRAWLRSLARVCGASFALFAAGGIASAGSWETVAGGWTSGGSFGSNGQQISAAPAGSSFVGIEAKSSFDLAPRSQPRSSAGKPFVLPVGTDELTKVRAVITHAESRRDGYDAYNLAARVPPPHPASTMTLREIQQWTWDTPGQQHAIGRYQIIPSTLNALIARTGISVDTVFDPQIQDAFANVLIIDAGYLALKDGTMSLDGFKAELAKVWAGFPLPTGESYYKGVANNQATISYEMYSRLMAQIFPAEASQVTPPPRGRANL
ncbi:hypothetical protein [Phaeovulum sp. W22_SRMD_FR3]|uniref:hypothetical protein n=1 Tax=Phaeovulum sp. W22_SRMD_FR3 TaxID=3240274 RepID=UPI003F9904E2